MDNKEFKKFFSEMGKIYGFKPAYGIFYIESTECLFVLELQKSNFSNLYYLNMKIFIQGYFGRTYSKDKETLKKHYGSVYTRLPDIYLYIFDLESDIPDTKRVEKMDNLFKEFIVPFSKKALFLRGIKELINENKLDLIPTELEELERLMLIK